MKIFIPLPNYGFDPTESAVPWNLLRGSGHTVIFVTPNAKSANADEKMLTGVGLPSILRKTLMAEPEAVKLYANMIASREFQNPLSYEQIHAEGDVALFLPGGHDKGMRPYLESSVLHKTIELFFRHNKPVAAICHGTLLVGRSKSETTGKSVLWGRKTTGLTRNQEMIAYTLTRLWLKDYYRTYDIPMAEELMTYLKSPSDFDPGPDYPVPLKRDSAKNLKPGFTVRDGNYLSARWPGDAHKFAQEFVAMIGEKR